MPRPNPSERSPRRTVRWVLLGVAGLVVVGVLASLAFAAFLAGTFDNGRRTIPDAFPASRAPRATGAAADAVNLLVLGYDADAVDVENPQLVGKQEADALMLVHIPADRGHVYVMSILRNTLVPVPGHGQKAINTALAYGGMPLQIQTVEGLLGVRIDHVVKVSLVGMRGFTEALGGVTVHNRSAFENDGYTFQPGTLRLDGARALAYIRSGDGAEGDAGRARAQAAYVRGVLDEVFRAKTLLNPAALATVVSVVSPYLAVDKGFDSAYIADLGLSLGGVRSDDVTTFALPAPTERRIGSTHVLELDRSALAQVRRHLADDSLDAYVP